MAEVLVIYASDHGATRKMAQAIQKGVQSVNQASARVLSVEQVKEEDLLKADAIVLGSPVHMGSMDWRIKKFIDQVCSGPWMSDSMVGKLGAVFACGSGFGNAGGGVELTMLAMLNNLVELGLIIIPLPKNSTGYPQGGLQWGPYGRAHNEDLSPIQGGLPDEKTLAAESHGANIARAALAISGKEIFK
ncbi:flavodoxin family protein [Dethiosulfatarculus sandiegensis]|nr:flavodoxin domain-containing protein [Dethiosulfatarculus sandiegensis]